MVHRQPGKPQRRGRHPHSSRDAHPVLHPWVRTSDEARRKELGRRLREGTRASRGWSHGGEGCGHPPEGALTADPRTAALDFFPSRNYGLDLDGLIGGECPYRPFGRWNNGPVDHALCRAFSDLIDSSDGGRQVAVADIYNRSPGIVPLPRLFPGVVAEAERLRNSHTCIGWAYFDRPLQANPILSKSRSTPASIKNCNPTTGVGAGETPTRTGPTPHLSLNSTRSRTAP